MNLPKEILEIDKKLKAAGFEAYLVGGCVRDFILKREPQDWDFTTSAKPEEILGLFEPEAFYENQFGTVSVKTQSGDPRLKIVEITPFRIEGLYADFRHPSEIKFVKTLQEDLSRRDFTINALAAEILPDENLRIVDLFDGEEDLKNKLIKTVGIASERFSEDPLRLMRAVRLATQLNFAIEHPTFNAILQNAKLIALISAERVRDEFTKILLSERAMIGVDLLQKTGLLKLIVPELETGINVVQNKHHIYTVYEHNLRSLDYAAQKDFSLEVRLAALLHDVAKPETKRGDGPDSTFYGHEIASARKAKEILRRLKFSEKIVDYVWRLIRYHMFYYDVDVVTEAGVRRFVNRVGTEYIPDLMKLRECDRIGSGVPKAQPYRLRHLKFMIEKAMREPISAKMLKLNGNDIMKILNIEPGPKVGWMLSILLEEVLDNPRKNDENELKKRVSELGASSDEELKKLAEKGKTKKEEFETAEVEDIKKKYFVK